MEDNFNDFPALLPSILTVDQSRSQEFNPIKDLSYQAIITNQFVPVGNVGAGPDDLMTYTIPANTLTSNKPIIGMKMFGTTANNANGKTLTFHFGVDIQSFAMTVSQLGYWNIDGYIIKTGINVQKIIFILTETTQSHALQTSKQALFFSQRNEVDTANIVVKLVATTVTSDNDLLQHAMLLTSF